jgi:hypothetical protein
MSRPIGVNASRDLSMRGRARFTRRPRPSSWRFQVTGVTGESITMATTSADVAVTPATVMIETVCMVGVVGAIAAAVVASCAGERHLCAHLFAGAGFSDGRMMRIERGTIAVRGVRVADGTCASEVL